MQWAHGPGTIASTNEPHAHYPMTQGLHTPKCPTASHFVAQPMPMPVRIRSEANAPQPTWEWHLCQPRPRQTGILNRPVS